MNIIVQLTRVTLVCCIGHICAAS